jgi:predicted DCC family thiol-disulfide oxidoreductase YuxK
VTPVFPSPDGDAAEMVFYDGTCGLCHRSVRFLLVRDRLGIFRFAPLDGRTFRERVPVAARAGLGDSFIVATADGRLLARAAGVRHALERLGGPWRLLAGLSRIVPIALADRLYNAVAATRYRLFRRPTEVCPVVPAELRSRFED